MTLDEIRGRLDREMVYRETMVSALRRLLQEGCQDIDADEVEKWAKLAEETTTGLDAVVGAAYEYLQMRVKGAGCGGVELPVAPPPPPAPPARAKPRGRCPIPDMNPPPF